MPSLTKENFEAIFRSEFKGLCFFAMKYVKDYEASREIVQDAFIQLWEKRATIDTGRPVKSYLTTTVQNRCLNYLRDNRKFDRNLLEIERLNVTDYETAADFLVEKELHYRIEDALAELPEKCREVFLLNRNEQLRYREIAEKLGISLKTVETRMSKALNHLRKRLLEFTGVLALLIRLFQG